jgi:ATP-dependent Clp protease protease subunit
MWPGDRELRQQLQLAIPRSGVMPESDVRIRAHASIAALPLHVQLEKHRTILLRGVIDNQAATAAIAKLLWLDHLNDEAPGWLYVDSPGGLVAESLAIIDTIDRVRLPIHTHCLAQAQGTALLLVAHGARGYRSSTGHARLAIERW